MNELSSATAANIAPLHSQQARLDGATKNMSDAARAKQAKKIEAAAKDFEAVFVTEMLRPMFEQIKPDDEFGGGKGEEIFNGLMMDQYGKLIAERGGIGLASQIKAEMIRMQEGSSK